MRWMRLTGQGLVTLMLLGAVAGAAVAQEPSPDPPPWFGGRVEAPEYGFAMTLPDDWVAFDLGADLDSQVEAASDLLDPGAWGIDGAHLLDLADFDSPFPLVSLPPAGTDLCIWGAVRPAVMSLDDAADGLPQVYADDPQARDAQPAQRIELPSGPAYRVDYTLLKDVDPEGPREMRSLASTFLLGNQEGLLVVSCETYGTRPADNWLTFLETVELLPTE